MICHYLGDSWILRSVPIETRNIGAASKYAVQLGAIIDDVMSNSPVFESDQIRVYTVTIDNEAAAAKAEDLFKIFLG